MDRPTPYQPIRFWKIALPILLVAIGLLLLVGLMPLALDQPGQMSIISSIITICFVIFPLLLCLTPLWFVLAVAIYYLDRAHQLTEQSLSRLHRLSDGITTRALNSAEQVSRRSIGIHASAAYWNRLVNVFDTPQKESDISHDSESTPPK